MNTRQAIKACIQIDPERSYCTDIERWRHQHTKDIEPATYKIATLPGFNGLDCQSFTGVSFEDCVAKVRAAINPPAPTDSDEAPEDEEAAIGEELA